jgi:DNA-binding GntR family transcriptional regulator
MASSDRSTFAGSQLQRRGAAELIAGEIRERIVMGELAPGDPLREADLVKGFGVARNTVREALRLLTQEGLAVHEVHHGVSVRRFTERDISELFQLRYLLESGVAKRAGTLDVDEIAALSRTLDATERADRSGDWREVLSENLEFHRELVRLLGNERISNLFDGLLDEMTLMLSALNTDVAGPWLPRNRELLELLIAGRRDEFAAKLEEYFDASQEDVLSRMVEPAT